MRAPSPGRGERGAVALLVALVLVVLLGFLALLLNAGHGTSAVGELQNGADAAALAAARELDGTDAGIAAARRVGAAFAALHRTDTTRPIEISGASDVRFCHWDQPAHAITSCLGWGASPGTSAELQQATAVQVRDGRQASRGNALPVWLSAFVGGTATMDAAADATAVGGGPCETRCVLPIAVSDCVFSGGTTCGGSVVYRNDNQDTAGFTNLNDSTGGVGNPEILEILAAATSASGCLEVTSGQAIDVKNGNVSAAKIWTILRGLVGRTFSVPVVHSDACKLNQQLPVAGFATIEITGVFRNSGDLPTAECAYGGKLVTPCITGRVVCGQTAEAPAGCGFFGLSTVHLRLVQ